LFDRKFRFFEIKRKFIKKQLSKTELSGALHGIVAVQLIVTVSNPVNISACCPKLFYIVVIH